MFSVIIPCRDRLEPLRFVLASFCRQHHAPPFEILLIDNNSDADIGQVHADYKTMLDLTLLRMPPLPHRFALCKARNMGLLLARYPWVISLDSDCVLNDGYLGALAMRCDADPRILVGERVFCNIAGQEVEAYLRGVVQPEDWPRVKSLSNYYQLVDRRMPQLAQLEESTQGSHPWAYVHGGNCSFRRADAIEVGGFDESFDGCWGYEDIDFAHRLSQHTHASIEYEAGMLTYHVEVAEIAPDPGRLAEMMDKTTNRNWRRITKRIAGFEDFKKAQYAQIADTISV
jgi:glycosyltransferase involved in cell wall biosynthesis